jgi:hypothetical protein
MSFNKAVRLVQQQRSALLSNQTLLSVTAFRFVTSSALILTPNVAAMVV